MKFEEWYNENALLVYSKNEYYKEAPRLAWQASEKQTIEKVLEILKSEYAATESCNTEVKSYFDYWNLNLESVIKRFKKEFGVE